MRTGHHCVRGFILPIHHCPSGSPPCQWIYSSGSPLCLCRLPLPCDCLPFTTVLWIVHTVHHCVRGFIPPVHHCVVGMSVVHHCAICDCLSVIQRCHGIVALVQQYVHGMILRVHHCVMGFINPLHHYVMVLSFCGLTLFHGTAPPVQHCITGLSLRFSSVSWGCPSGSQLWFCPFGSSPSHGTDPLVHRYVMGLFVWFTSTPCGIVPLVRRHVTGLFLRYTALSWGSPLISPLCSGITIRSTSVPWCKPSTVPSDSTHQIIWHLTRILC